jgi:trigger factor
MQVTVEATSGLQRRMTVRVPEDAIATEVSNRLKSLSGTARVHGFRPGKVPMKVIERTYGSKVRGEVVSSVVRSTFLQAVTEQRLVPAAEPVIDAVDASPGAGVSYTAVFEVYPEVGVPDVAALKITRLTAEVTEDDVDGMVQTLRRQRRTWEPVERPAAPGDRVQVDYQGTVDGEAFTGGDAQAVQVEIGSHKLIDGFEDGLVGARPGEERTLELRFPAGYQRTELADRPVSFRVSIRSVSEPRLPELDEDFYRSFGLAEGGVEAFRREIRENMERELRDTIQTKLKQQVMDAILGALPLQVPEVLVRAEAERLLRQTRETLAQQGMPATDLQLGASVFEAQARRRVALGLILAEVVKAHQFRADPQRVRRRVEAVAATYEDPAEVVRWYYGNRQRLSEIESVVLEDQLVDWVLGQASVIEERATFDALMKPGQTSA